MLLVFRCPSCNAKIQTSLGNVGRKAKCQTCKSVISIPIPDTGQPQQAERAVGEPAVKSRPSRRTFRLTRRHAAILLVGIATVAGAALLYNRSQTPIDEMSADASPTGPSVPIERSAATLASDSPDEASASEPPPNAADESQQTDNTAVADAAKSLPAVGDPSDAPMDLAALFSEVSSSVVKIHILDDAGDRIGHGSGFFLDKSEIPASASSWELDRIRDTTFDFLLVTNYHVLYPAHDIEFECSEGKLPLFALEVLAESETLDLALLRAVYSVYDDIAAPTPQRSEFPLDDMPAGLRLGERPSIGTSVFAIGSPAGLTNSLSEGIVSGYRHIENRIVLQTTVPISEGSSGGALFNSRGKVVGVTTSTLKDAQNVNFAVPVSAIRYLLGSDYSGPEPRYVSDGARLSRADFTLRLAYFAPLEHDEELRKYCESASEADCESRRASAIFPTLSDEDRQILSRLRAAHAIRFKLFTAGGYAPREMQVAVDALENALEQDCGEYTYLMHYLLSRSIRIVNMGLAVSEGHREI